MKALVSVIIVIVFPNHMYHNRHRLPKSHVSQSSHNHRHQLSSSRALKLNMLAPLLSPERAAKRRRTGGWRQQRAREAPDDDDTHDMSHLAAGHLLEWCDGVESATQVRDHMRNAIRDRIGHPMVKRFSDIGGSGHNGQHCHQGLMRLLGKCGIHKCITPLPSPSDVSSVLLPSTLIRLLYERYPSMFRIRLGANERMIVKFWTQFLARAENAKWAATHPALRGKLPIELRLTVPCSMHEDAGPISKLSSADCVSWSSIVGEGDEKVTHLLSWSYIKSKSSSLDKKLRLGRLLEGLGGLSNWFRGRASRRSTRFRRGVVIRSDVCES